MNLGEKLRRLKPMTPKTKAVVAAERAVVKAAMAWHADNQWDGMGSVNLTEKCSALLAARGRAKTKKARGSP